MKIFLIALGILAVLLLGIVALGAVVASGLASAWEAIHEGYPHD